MKQTDNNTPYITLGSLFDGIGGFPFCAQLSGIVPLWAAEIDPACVAVTKRHFPNMLHYGDVSKINGADIPPVDIITFGSPCQDLSVAGKRKGLKHKDNGDNETTRSGLFVEAIRIIYEMREATNGRYPAYIVWENVPGAFSSHNGHDFQTVLEEITQTDIPMPASGKWANAGVVRGREICAAWRLLDAQYWGVPQRRKRIYLVGSFGNNSAEEILFKCDSVQRYLTPCRKERERASADTGTGIEGGNFVFDARGNGDGITSPTITGDHNNRVTDYSAVVCSPIAVREQCGCEGDDKGLATSDNQFVYSAGFLDRAPAESYSIGYEEEKSPTLRAGMIPSVLKLLNTADRHSVVYAIDRAAFNQGKNAKYDFEISDSGINSTVVAKGPSAVAYKFIEWIVRRLTPLECERLQGYPDNWTVLPKIENMSEAEYEFFKEVFMLDKQIRGKSVKKPPTWERLIKWYNKLDCDGTRYRQLGNSLAIPCALRVIGYIADYIRTPR